MHARSLNESFQRPRSQVFGQVVYPQQQVHSLQSKDAGCRGLPAADRRGSHRSPPMPCFAPGRLPTGTLRTCRYLTRIRFRFIFVSIERHCLIFSIPVSPTGRRSDLPPPLRLPPPPPDIPHIASSGPTDGADSGFVSILRQAQDTAGSANRLRPGRRRFSSGLPVRGERSGLSSPIAIGAEPFRGPRCR